MDTPNRSAMRADGVAGDDRVAARSVGLRPRTRGDRAGGAAQLELLPGEDEGGPAQAVQGEHRGGGEAEPACDRADGVSGGHAVGGGADSATCPSAVPVSADRAAPTASRMRLAERGRRLRLVGRGAWPPPGDRVDLAGEAERHRGCEHDGAGRHESRGDAGPRGGVGCGHLGAPGAGPRRPERARSSADSGVSCVVISCPSPAREAATPRVTSPSTWHRSILVSIIVAGVAGVYMLKRVRSWGGIRPAVASGVARLGGGISCRRRPLADHPGPDRALGSEGEPGAPAHRGPRPARVAGSTASGGCPSCSSWTGSRCASFEGTLVVLGDSGFNDDEAMNWLLDRGGEPRRRPIDALRGRAARPKCAGSRRRWGSSPLTDVRRGDGARRARAAARVTTATAGHPRWPLVPCSTLLRDERARPARRRRSRGSSCCSRLDLLRVEVAVAQQLVDTCRRT